MKNSCLLSKFVKKGTFLDAYINKNKGYITPYVYDFWNGMHLLSTIAGCKSYFESTYNVFRLNLYIMYLNDSNFDLHHDAIRAVYDEKSDDELINSPTSVESMITLLTSLSESGITGVRIVTTDIVNFFKNSRNLAFYSDNYLCPKERSGFNGKYRYTYRNPYINICSSGNINDYFTITNCNDFSDDFSTKTIIITTKTKDKQVEPRDPECYRIYEEAKKTLLQKAPFHITFSDSAASYYRKRYKSSRNGVRKQFGPREHVLAIKLAGLLAINESKENQSMIKCSLENIQDAYKIIEYTQSQLYSYLNSLTNLQEVQNYDKAIEKIRKLIIAAGENGVTNNELYQKVRTLMTNEEYTVLMSIMHELDLVNKYVYRNGSAVLYAQNEHTATFNSKIVRKTLREKNNT